MSGLDICLLGGNGFIGSHVQDELLRCGHKVLVYDRQDEKFRYRNAEIEYVKGDISDHRLLGNCLPGTDCIIHLASSILPAASNKDPIFDVKSNLVTTLKLLQLCVDHNVKKIVYISTGGIVYGFPKRLPICEDDSTEPICSYGIVKLAIEKYIALFARLYGIEYRILRPSNPFGERQDPMIPHGAITVFLWRILSNQPISVFGDGNTIRDYLYVGDLSRAICLTLRHHGPSRIFNVGSGSGQSLNEIIDQISSLLDVRVKVERYPARPFDIPEIVLDTGRIQREMDWRPQIPMEDGLRRTLGWLLEKQKLG